ncbi:MAG TPA: UDP-N-acetylglucosamine 1-carboxyvinyltransferase [Candidatus Polarisedimenticolaceae bacterium]|nr:UDP-N-acetylglucosamine 1-carboxyvinyltransferase [Candidatus Polarisedimenticolaceae bacterium]
MDKIIVQGGKRLTGEVTVSGSKNAALPILIASLLTAEPCRYQRVPNLADIHTTLKLLGGLGVKIDKEGWARGTNELMLEAEAVRKLEASYDLVKTMRASFLVLGPLTARFGQARVSTPGGCAIGARPVNLHLKGLEAMGATIEHSHGYIEANAVRLRGAKIYLDLPSVGATENLMMAATLADGTTVIENAAKEPEIEDLANVLNKMGGRVRGAGTDIVQIDGVESLHGFSHEIIPDRIEAGSFVIASAITGGDVWIKGARAEHLDAFLIKLQEAGVLFSCDPGGIRVQRNGKIKSVDVTTLPYPGFATDLQAQMMVLMSVADGVSVITETIFENRFMHAQELDRMGAQIQLEGNRAVVRGARELSGAPVMATDLRASISLILAGLVASGSTEVFRVYHLDRGYEHIEEKLSNLGAQIERVKA